jgi:hypothetical protein
MEEQITVVFRGGPFGGQFDTVPVSEQPRYYDTRDGQWALYSLSDETENDRRVLVYQHGSEDPVPAS